MLTPDQHIDFDAMLLGHAAVNGRESAASRRTALKMGIGVGYAATMLPIRAAVLRMRVIWLLRANYLHVRVLRLCMAKWPN